LRLDTPIEVAEARDPKGLGDMAYPAAAGFLGDS
jgi:adenylylsulfate kinase-like enzyme